LQFTRLRLTGFKSFVDPTELVISAGLTGVVGPNGCGKSNLLEAIRWVMGEGRASAMRGDGMEDVIFAGSSARPARSHAEVTLTLDNRDRRAPAGFNDADTLEVVRRITRDAGSAYRANGREARARDVAMLFADAATGAQSPALVRQGQISDLINARPQARRRILEEAAGISGLHQRRHEAELKLHATQTNLGRVGDVLEAMETQIATLGRQAKQAARYREIAAGLRRVEGLLLYRFWRDAEDERAAAAAARLAATRAAAAAQAAATEAARLREAADAALRPARDEDAVAGAVLARATLERERLDAATAEAARRIAALEATRAQLAADRTRELTLDGDAEAMDARLTAERTALDAADDGHAEAAAAARTEAEAAAAALRRVEAGFDAKVEAAARLTADHRAATARRLEAERRATDVARALRATEAGLAGAERDHAGAGAACDDAAKAAARARHAADAAEAALSDAEAAAAAASAAAAATRAALAETGGGARALAAEVLGLERLLARPKDATAQILDRVRVVPGFEAALGAALGEDLSHPAENSAEDPGAATGWRALPPLDAAALPDGATPLGPWIDAPPALSRRLVAVGLVDAASGSRLQAALRPGQRLVSREGDLWRWDGLRLAADATPSAAAQRLEQINRLDALRVELARVDAEAEAARAAHSATEALLADAACREAAARAARRGAEQAAVETARAVGRAEAAAELARGKAEGLRAGRVRRAEELAVAEAARAQTVEACAALSDPATARQAMEAERLVVETARVTMLTRRAQADELARAAAARERRLTEIARDLDGWRARRATAAERLADLARREADAAAALRAAKDEPLALATRREGLAAALVEAEARRRRGADALAVAEAALRAGDAALRASERTAAESREARARTEAQAEAAEERAAAATERLQTEAEAEPETLLARLNADEARIPPTAELEGEIQRLRRSRDALGAVNLRAEADACAVRVEFDALAGERADLEEAIRTLRLGIANLNREGRGRLIAAFDEVNRNFAALFKHLFGGGEAALTLVESDDPLQAGLEIVCQPPGKKLSTLSLLSGGEQTLTALSLIFAVFLANPSPICVLDEVDAPLDDANVARFCDLLKEMTGRTDTRFLIITHHAVTMSRMDRLYGVTMAEPGVSQLVSVDLAGAERFVEVAV